MNTKREIEWGVIQQLTVEADTRQSLVAALTIAMAYFPASHYTVIDHELRIGSEGTAFLTPISSPERLAAEVERWLATATYPESSYRGDGSMKKGWRVSVESSIWKSYVTIKPVWIVYGK
jgi:hypothetical protein